LFTITVVCLNEIIKQITIECLAVRCNYTEKIIIIRCSAHQYWNLKLTQTMFSNADKKKHNIMRSTILCVFLYLKFVYCYYFHINIYIYKLYLYVLCILCFLEEQHISMRYGMFDKHNRDLTGNVCRQNSWK